MYLNVTHLMNRADQMRFLSASIAELGEDAGSITWANCLKEAEAHSLLTTEEQFEQFRRYAEAFGAWDDDEIAAMSPLECNAFMVQETAARIRERMQAEERGELEAFEENFGGCLCQDDSGEWFYYMGP